MCTSLCISDTEAARIIFGRAYKYMKDNGLKEERKILLDSWHDFEKSLGKFIYMYLFPLCLYNLYILNMDCTIITIDYLYMH